MHLSLIIVVILSVFNASIHADVTNKLQIKSSIPRIKRSGSFDFVGHIKSGLVSGITRASASVAAGSSGSSSGSSSSSNDQKGYHYPNPTHHDENNLNGVQLKKAIFNTLFQAVKAITGGVTAIKGRLIKGSGYLVSASGNLIAASGDSVTSVGKKIVNSAHLVPPGPSHFAKFSSLSSIPHASSGTSSSSSSHQNSHSGHEASFTSFEAPTSHSTNGGSYDSHSSISTGYGAPTINSGPSGHSSLNSYLPPSSHGTSYDAPLQTYGTPNHGSSHSGNYENSYNEVHASKNTYETHEHSNNDFTAHASSINGLNQHSESLKSAAEALRQILHKLPTPTSTHNQHSSTHDSHTNNHHLQLTQFDIPPDPESPPPFKPLKPHNSYHDHGYLPPAEPLQTISHTHIITTAYGAPITDYQKPAPLVDVHTAWKRSKNTSPNQHQIPNDHNAYNMYHKMTLKRSPHIHNSNTQSRQQLKHIAKQNTLITHDTQNHQHEMDNLVHQQQLNKIKNTIGSDFEIQKSVGFELNEHEPAQIKRRISSALAQS